MTTYRETQKFTKHATAPNTKYSEKGTKSNRKARARNILQLVNSDFYEELQNEDSDYPHLFTKQRSSVRFLINNIIFNVIHFL